MLHPIAMDSKASIEKEDLSALLRIVQPMRLKNIVEIGTWKGYSAQVWDEAFHPDLFITIDKDSDYPDNPTIYRSNYHYLWNSDSSSQDTWSKVTSLLGDTAIDFLFIDGDHSVEGVLKDWNHYSHLVRKGGAIALHDICIHRPPTEEVDLLWNRLKTEWPYVELKASKNSTGLGILFV